MGVPVVKGGQNLPTLDGIGLTDLPNIGGELPSPPGPPVLASLYTDLLSCTIQSKVGSNGNKK